MLKFKKIASLMASTLMVGSTVALAAAATYPAPFVSGGSPNVGIVYGSSAAITDLVAATNIMDNLNTHVVGTSSTGSTTTVSGEAYPLFTSSSPLQLNASVDSVRSSVTETSLPSVLGDSDFAGNVDATASFTIKMGSNPRVVFAKEPTSSDDPVTGISLGTTAANALYNATVTFSKAINFTHADSEGEEIMLFGQKFTVAAATDTTSLVLLKSSEELTLTNDDPSAEVTIDGETYTVELISASDTGATIRVTDSSGSSDSKTIAEAASKTVQGLEVAIDTADENNFQLTATLSVGSSRIKLTDSSEVTIGTSEDVIEGTQVDFGDTTYPGNLTSLTIQVFAPSGSEDFITPETAYVDPVFGSFKVDFSGLSISDDGVERELIEVKASGNDKMTLDVTNWQGKTLTNFGWLNNESGDQVSSFLGDSSEWRIRVDEMGQINESAYAIVGNEDEGYLIKLRTLTNSTGTTGDRYSNDKITFENVFDTTQTWDATITSEGSGTINIGGNDYAVTYVDDKAGNGDAHVRLNSPDSSGNNMILYPSIETSKGAKLILYEPLTINITNWDGSDNDLAGLLIPDGDGYDTTTFTAAAGGNAVWTTTGGTLNTSQGNSTCSVAETVGQLTYSLTSTGNVNETKVFLRDPAGTDITNPAVILIEEKDEGNLYHATIIQTGGAGTSDNGMGVSDVDFSWNTDADMSGSAYGSSGLQMESDEDLYKMMDLWGTLVTTDQSTSDQYTATISYPDEQVTAILYVAEESAAISTTGGSTGGGTTVGVPLLDSEVSSASGKNLIVVGGSCVNTVAADLLGSSSPLCTADFTASTGVGAGQYLIETFSRSSGTVATLVAGYNAADTTNAATALRTQSITTDVGTKYIGTTSTSLEMQTEAAE